MDAQVVHQVPGRVRIRFDRASGARGWSLAHWLAAHPAVRSVIWNAANRSLVVEHDPATPLTALLAQAAPVDRPPPAAEDTLVRLAGAVASALLPLPVQALLILLTQGRRPVTAV